MSETNDLKFTIKDCDHVIRQCFQRKDIKTCDFEIIPRHKDNYIFKITFEDGSQKETSCLYAKSRSKVPKIEKIFEDFGKIVEFDRSVTPKFFCGKSELLFFEDLTCQRFQNEYDSFGLKHIQNVLGVLAKIHVSGFVYEHKKKKKLNEEYNLEETNFDVKDTEDLLWGLITDKEKINEVVSDLEERQVSSKFRKTLCHGNLKKDNILFHYNNGVPDDCKLVNFNQIYAPPVYDVLQVIYLNTNGSFRQKYLESLIRHYYNCLEEEFSKHGLEITKFFSFEDLESYSHEFLPLIKLESTISLPKNGESIKELKEILNETRLSREDCYIIVKNKIESTEYELLSFCILQNLKLEIKIRHSSNEETINCFVKCAPTKPEIFFFGEFLPKLENFEITTMRQCCPSCFFYRSEDVIVFEDLSLLDYQQQNSYDFNSLVTILQLLAKLHGSSLIFEEKMGETMKKTYRLIDDYSKNFANKIIDHQFRNVLCHGSITSKNIFVKFDEGKIVDCLVVGFENIMYCSPAFDVFRLLQIGDATVKNKHKELGKIYFEELTKIVASFGYNINKFFSYQEFVQSFEDVKQTVD